MSRWAWVAVAGWMAFLVGGCKDENGPGSPSNVVFPSSGVSYGRHVQPLFNQACNFGGCHDGTSQQTALNLTSYSGTVFSLPGVVIPGDTVHSTLVLSVEGKVGTIRMPPSGNGLTDNQIKGIRTWIAEGAKDN